MNRNSNMVGHLFKGTNISGKSESLAHIAFQIMILNLVLY